MAMIEKRSGEIEQWIPSTRDWRYGATAWRDPIRSRAGKKVFGTLIRYRLRGPNPA